ESGFDPAIKAGDYAKTGSVGLMQVTAATASEMRKRFPAATSGRIRRILIRAYAPACCICGYVTIICCRSLVLRCSVAIPAWPTIMVLAGSAEGDGLALLLQMGFLPAVLCGARSPDDGGPVTKLTQGARGPSRRSRDGRRSRSLQSARCSLARGQYRRDGHRPGAIQASNYGI